MNFDKEYELLEKLYFERVSGSEGEKQACLLLKEELEKLGLHPVVESFDTQHSVVEKVTLEVCEPYQKEYQATAYKGCQSTEANGLLKELCYFESDNPVSRKMVKDKIALINGYLNRATYQAITEAGAKAFISYNGDVDRAINDLDPRELRESLQKLGNLPGVNILVKDAMEMVANGASQIRMTIQQENTKTPSYNLVCDLKGESDEVIVLCAHYDSVPHSKGPYDNASGVVALYAIAEKLRNQKLHHTLRLLFCGSEERGLCGSQAYIKQHASELDNIQFVINIDMIGSTMGKRIAVCTSEEALVHYTDYYAKMVGFPLQCSQAVYPSDSTSFADAGIPAITFARDATKGTGSIHSRYDVLENLCKNKIEEDTEFICGYVESMLDAYVIPVAKEMPENMKRELDRYQGREKKRS